MPDPVKGGGFIANRRDRPVSNHLVRYEQKNPWISLGGVCYKPRKVYNDETVDWRLYEDELRARKDSELSPEKRRKVRALVLHRAATRAVEAEKQCHGRDLDIISLLQEMLEGGEDESPESLFELSIDVDDGFPDVHLDLVD